MPVPTEALGHNQIDERSSTAEHVERREELSELVADVRKLPPFQRKALVFHEFDGLAYEEIAGQLDTSLGAVKSLLVRARTELGHSNDARRLGCDEVRAELESVAAGAGRITRPSRLHVRRCERCAAERERLGLTRRAAGALIPFGFLGDGLRRALSNPGGSGTTGGSGALAASGGGIVAKAAATIAVATIATGAAAESRQPDHDPGARDQAGALGSAGVEIRLAARVPAGHVTSPRAASPRQHRDDGSRKPTGREAATPESKPSRSEASPDTADPDHVPAPASKPEAAPPWAADPPTKDPAPDDPPVKDPPTKDPPTKDPPPETPPASDPPSASDGTAAS